MQHTSQGNPFVVPADISAKVDEIMASARSRFGHDAFRMEDPPADPAPSDPPADPAPSDPPADPPADPAKDPKSGDAQDVSALPDWAQKLIKDTRDEAAKHRTGKTAAETKYQETLDNIGKALGLKEDGEKDPEKLAGELTKAQQAQREAAVELAVYRAAGKHQGDPDALLDSRTFLAKVRDLDPTESDFSDKVGEAIKSAVADNPKLKTAPAAGKGGAELNGGSGEGATKEKPKTLDAAVRQHYDA